VCLPLIDKPKPENNWNTRLAISAGFVELALGEQ